MVLSVFVLFILFFSSYSKNTETTEDTVVFLQYFELGKKYSSTAEITEASRKWQYKVLSQYSSRI